MAQTQTLMTLGEIEFVSLIAMPIKELEMLQPDTFCEHTMQQNVTATGAPPGPCWGAYSAPTELLAGFKGAVSRREGKGGKVKGR